MTATSNPAAPGLAPGGPSGPPTHLVCLFCVTAGQNGENLGSDEEQIVLIVYLLYDLSNNKVITLQEHYVRPAVAEDLVSVGETVLTEECRIQTGLSEQRIKNAQPLEVVLDELERFLCSKEIHPQHGGKPFCLVTDGQLHLRMCLHPEASLKSIILPQHYHRFYDLRKELKKHYKTERPINCIKDMLDFLGLENDQSIEYGVRHCQDMAAIVHRLVNDGHVFRDFEVIQEQLEPGVCSSDDVVDDETVVRARGLPWQSSDQDIARFFKGLNLAKGGVALCLSQQGRRNGEALVRLESREHRDLALRKHKHHIGLRYIEIYRASGEDFLAVAGGNNEEAQAFLSKRGNSGHQVIVRMRGLPYTCKADQVKLKLSALKRLNRMKQLTFQHQWTYAHSIEFFREAPSSVEVLDGEEGILFVHQADGRATGDCFVLFATEEDANQALTKHRQSIGSRYIELFKSTTAEVQQVLNRSMDPRNTVEEVLHGFAPPGALFTALTPAGALALPALVLPPQQLLITSGTRRDCVRLRGLPLETTVADILSFLGEHSKHIVLQGVHQVYNSMGLPSGESFIQMDSELSAEATFLSKHHRTIQVGLKKNKIDVIQCSGQDMNLVLTAGLSSTPLPILSTAPQTPYSLTPGGFTPGQSIPGSGEAALVPVLPSPALQRALMPPPPCNTEQQQQHDVLSVTSKITPNFFAPPPMSNYTPYSSASFLIPAPAAPQPITMNPQIPQPITMHATGNPQQINAQTTLTTAANPQLLCQSMITPRPPLTAGPQLVSVNPPSAPYSAYQPMQTIYVSNTPMLPPQTLINGSGLTPMTDPNYSNYQSLVYWYPSPPVSPQRGGALTYIQPYTGAAAVSIKGLPSNVQAQDILNFLDGLFEVIPDVQIMRLGDGHSTCEAIVTFHSRAEAEKVLRETNKRLMGNQFLNVCIC